MGQANVVRVQSFTRFARSAEVSGDTSADGRLWVWKEGDKRNCGIGSAAQTQQNSF
jgi:hypothetical protein